MKITITITDGERRGHVWSGEISDAPRVMLIDYHNNLATIATDDPDGPDDYAIADRIAEDDAVGEVSPTVGIWKLPLFGALRCDGDHAEPACAAPGCWHRWTPTRPIDTQEKTPEPVKVRGDE